MQTSVGTLLPGQTATVHVTYTTEVGQEGPSLRFLLPTLLAPRYALGVGMGGDAAASAAPAFLPAEGRQQTAAVGLVGASPVGYPLTVRVHVVAASPILAVRSPSHPEAVHAVVGAGVPDNDARTKAEVTLGLEGGAGEPASHSHAWMFTLSQASAAPHDPQHVHGPTCVPFCKSAGLGDSHAPDAHTHLHAYVCVSRPGPRPGPTH